MSGYSLVWDYFTKVEKEDSAICKKETCKKKIPIKSGNTSGLNSHLKLKHAELFKKLNEDKEKKNEEKKATKNKKNEDHPLTKQPLKQPKLSFINRSEAERELQDKFNDALVEYVATSGVSFNQAAKLTDVIHSINKKIQVPSSKVLSRRMENKADFTLKKVHNILAAFRSKIVSVGFTTDLWTSRAGDAYISLTCSFIDHFWRLHRYTPYVRHFPGAHTGVCIALELDDMILELKLDSMDIVKYSVNDNASNQKKAIRESAYLIEYNCDLHTMQLLINDTFNEVEGMKNVLKSCKAIAKFTKQSTQAMEQLKKECKKRKIAFRKPKNSQETRWNSAYTCMESILHLKVILKDLSEVDDKWTEFSLNFREWKLLEGAVKLLKPFLVSTKILEAEKTPTINLVIEQIMKLQSGLDAFICRVENCQHGITFARCLLKNLKIRFPDGGSRKFERRAANFLDPRLKGIHLASLGSLEGIKGELEDRYGSRDDNLEDELEAAPSVELSPTSRLLRQAKQRKKQTGESRIRSEMSKYEAFSFAARDSNILYWWKCNETLLPLLARIAHIILAIPSSSAKSERVFSTGGNVVTAKRCRLGPKKVEQLIVIKENLSKVKEFELFYSEDVDIEDLDCNPFAKIVAHLTQDDSLDTTVIEIGSSDEKDDFLDDENIDELVEDDSDDE